MVCLEIAREEQAKLNLAFEFNLAAFRLVEETLKTTERQIVVGALQYGCQHFISGEFLFITPFG